MNQQLEKNKDNVIRIQSTFKVIIVVCYGLILLLFVFPMIASLIVGEEFTLIINYNIAIIPFLLLLTVSIITQIKLYNISIFKSKKMTELDICSLIELRKLVLKFADLMELETQKIKVWRSDSKTYFPSIQEGRNGIYHLILPMNFFFLLFNNKSQAEALLIHELGHMKHEDTKLWLYNIVMYRWIKFFVFPFTSLLFVIYILDAFKGFIFGEIPLPGVYMRYMIIIGMAKIVSDSYESLILIRLSRESSEKLADYLVIIHGYGDSLIKVISDFSTKKDTKFHLKKFARIRFVEEIQKRYNFSNSAVIH